MHWDGWDEQYVDSGAARAAYEYTHAWVYVSASSFKIVGADVTYKFPVGTRVRCTNNSTTFYGVVVSTAFSTDTTVTLAPNDDYALANSAITNPAVSHMANAPGYPFWFNYTPTYTGFTATVPSAGNNRFAIVGNLCFLNIAPATNGTSNATTFTVTAPVAVATGAGFQVPCRGFDNGAALAGAACATVGGGSSTINLFTNMALAAWTNANGKRAVIVLAYPI